MTISLAFLAPTLVRGAVEGRLPRGINIERLRDASAEWSRQFDAREASPRTLQIIGASFEPSTFRRADPSEGHAGDPDH
jgi:hypothetical protein